MKRLWIRLFSIWMITFSLYFLNQSLIQSLVMDTDEVNITALAADRYKKLLNINNNSNKYSSKVTKIGFLKIHKCASSTLQNILIRFAIFNKLNVVLPQKGSQFHSIEYVSDPDARFNRSMIEDTPWNLAGMPNDIFCLHSIWNYAEVSANLGEGAVYFTMIRHPVELFRSFWDYFNYGEYYNMTLQQFSQAIDTSMGKQEIKIKHPFARYLHHGLLCDFGIPEQKLKDKKFIDEKISEIDDNFDLILIQERFDDSIILLKDLLFWDNTDLLHLKLNYMSSTKSKLTEETIKSLSSYLEADIRVYDYFYKKFEQKVQAFGENRLNIETMNLKEDIVHVKDVCGVKEVRQVYQNSTLVRDGHN